GTRAANGATACYRARRLRGPARARATPATAGTESPGPGASPSPGPRAAARAGASTPRAARWTAPGRGRRRGTAAGRCVRAACAGSDRREPRTSGRARRSNDGSTSWPMRNRSVTRMHAARGGHRRLRENRRPPYLPTVSSPRDLLRTIRDELRQQFLERGELIDGALIGLLAGQHLLVIGPPGTAKSMLADEV